MMKKHLHCGTNALNLDTVIVIRIPDAQVLRILSRSLFLAMVLATLPFLGTIFKDFSTNSHSKIETSSWPLLNLILHDMTDEGLLKKDDKALIVSPPNGFGSIVVFNNTNVDFIMDSDLETKSLFPNESCDFVFTSSSIDSEFVDRILKVGGIVALPLGAKPSNAAFREQSNYRVVYLRRYSPTSIIVALRKTRPPLKLVVSSAKRKLCRLTSDAKIAALNGLEDVLLEPPRHAFEKSKNYLKKIKYLPNLLGDSLEGYNRRLFVSIGVLEENKGVIEWFERNYPKKNTKFEIHSLMVAPEDRILQPHRDVSSWLSKHVNEEEYVVMKAEAEIVEEMIEKGAICLVDELFLECKNEWWQKEKRKKSVKAYWECLALYGRLRDEGVAVHQWWG